MALYSLWFQWKNFPNEKKSIRFSFCFFFSVFRSFNSISSFFFVLKCVLFPFKMDFNCVKNSRFYFYPRDGNCAKLFQSFYWAMSMEYFRVASLLLDFVVLFLIFLTHRVVGFYRCAICFLICITHPYCHNQCVCPHWAKVRQQLTCSVFRFTE